MPTRRSLFPMAWGDEEVRGAAAAAVLVLGLALEDSRLDLTVHRVPRRQALVLEAAVSVHLVDRVNPMWTPSPEQTTRTRHF